MQVDNLSSLKMADGSELKCSLFGLSHSGRLYIEVHGVTWREAGDIFEDPEKTRRMTFPFSDGPVTRVGFTVFEGVDNLENGGVRVTMRRRYEGEED